MSEGKLLLTMLGLSVALHGGILYISQIPETPQPEPWDTVVEIELAPKLFSKPEGSASAPKPEGSESSLPTPQDVTVPDVTPKFPEATVFSPTKDSFLPQAPTLPPSTVPKTSSPTVLMEYRDVLRAWINRHKRYPRLAERQGIEGEPHLRLTVARDGSVIRVRIERSSGSPVLDRAALDMVERAKPFPGFPPHVREHALEYIIPINFSLD